MHDAARHTSCSCPTRHWHLGAVDASPRLKTHVLHDFVWHPKVAPPISTKMILALTVGCQQSWSRWLCNKATTSTSHPVAPLGAHWEPILTQGQWPLETPWDLLQVSSILRAKEAGEAADAKLHALASHHEPCPSRHRGIPIMESMLIHRTSDSLQEPT